MLKKTEMERGSSAKVLKLLNKNRIMPLNSTQDFFKNLLNEEHSFLNGKYKCKESYSEETNQFFDEIHFIENEKYVF